MSVPPVIFDALGELRSEIEEVAADATLPPQDRAARLTEFRTDLMDMVGNIDSYLGDVVNETTAAEREHYRDVMRLRENAEIRERLIQSGEATAEDCDAIMLWSHTHLDELAEEGLLQEAALSASSFFSGIKFDPKKHPRGRGGKFTDVFNSISKLADGGEHKIGPDVSVHKSEGKFTVKHRGKTVHKTHAVEDATRVGIERAAIPAPPAKPARKSTSAVEPAVAQRAKDEVASRAAERDLPQEEKSKLYQERRAGLERRASAAVAGAAMSGKLTSAEAHFNDAGKVSQRTLANYVEEASTKPQTVDLYSKVDPSTGHRVWDESRRVLHERIISAYLKKRSIDPATGKEVLDYNPDAADLTAHPDGPTVLFSGGGYAPLALDTPIATPSGWSTMGALEVGDLVFDADGFPTVIEGVSEVFTNRRCFEVEFDDGSRIVADADHKWLTSTFASRKSKGRAALRVAAMYPQYSRDQSYKRVLDATRPTWEIAETITVSPGDQGPKANHAIENPAPLVLAHAVLPIDPYVLGAWLGDGTTKDHTLTCADEEIVWQIRTAGYSVEPKGESGGGCPRWSIKPLHRPLRLAGLLGNKHIPAEYLRASADQRRALLAGLMDTDGTVGGNGSCEFTTTLSLLAEGVSELLVSLGIKNAITEGRAMLDGRDMGTKYRVHFTTAMPVFRLPRKLERQHPKRDRRAGKWARRYIVAMHEVASVPTRCIAVASESHLFLAGRAMVPTHNSGKGGVLKILGARGEMPPDAFVLDPDQIKAELPEFQAMIGTDPEANMHVYREAWAIAQEIQARAMDRKLNIVVDGISNTSPEEMGQRARAFTSRGYAARAVYVDIPTEEAMKRASNRAVNAKDDSDRRMIPEIIMRSVHRDVAATVPSLPGYLDDHQIPLDVEVWDNDQGKDDAGNFNPPRPFFKFAGGKREVVDQALWDRFQRKGHETILHVDAPGGAT